ncbi:MAG: hypothetical protein ABW321_09975 [Polyangiales bacterium]
MSSIPNQSIYGVPLQSGFGGSTNPWGSPAAPGETSALPPLSEADRAGLEAQALNGFLQEAAANAIRKLFHYLESNSPAFPQLNAQLPVLTQAVDAYRTGNFPHAFTLAFQVFRAIVLFQSLNREMPSIPAS